MKYILTIALSALLFASCQTSHGCGCLHADVQPETETVQPEA